MSKPSPRPFHTVADVLSRNESNVGELPAPVPSLRTQRVLVTGGAGFIGVHLTQALVNDEHCTQVFVVDDLSRTSSMPDFPDGVKFVQQDLSVPCDELIKKLAPDIVFHLASAVGGCEHVMAREAHMLTKTLAIDVCVANACASASVAAVVYVSTACAYPAAMQAFDEPKFALLEDSHMHQGAPHSGYGLAKRTGEIVFSLRCRDTITRLGIARLHNVYGEGAILDDSAQVITGLCLRAALGQVKALPPPTLAVKGSGDQFRDFVHVQDVVAGLLALYKHALDRAPVQIGSGKAVSISEVAALIVPSTTQLSFDHDSPEGDRGRVADTHRAKSILCWTPKVSLQDGLTRTRNDVLQRLPTLAVGLPFTSRGLTETDRASFEKGLRLMAQGLPHKSRVYAVIDSDDPLLGERSETELTGWLSQLLGVPSQVRKKAPVRPAPLYKWYNELCKWALEDDASACEYFVLWGDDVRMMSGARKCWMEQVQRRFREYERAGCPPGLGCVALNDISSPGFPTFPIVHREHIKCFGGFCPDVFVNQDADPFVFALYRRWGCSSILDSIMICNEIGGTDRQPRYTPEHVDWKGHILSDGVQRVARHFSHFQPTHLVLDVVVPTYRCSLPALRRILTIKEAPQTSTLLHVIVDNPTHENAVHVRELERESQFQGRVRVRVQPRNMGVSKARNRGLDESDADWIVFIDDDVEPDLDILCSYATAVRDQGENSSGFVGLTSFPPPSSPSCLAADLSSVTYFWSIAARMPQPPWGVTANLCTRRTSVRFHPDFIGTGGGEDIALCLDTVQATGLPLSSAPEARAVHPWWDDGNFSPWRFFLWTQGDGLLRDKYPKWCYRRFPNALELVVLCLVLALVALGFGNAAVAYRLIFFVVTAISASFFALEGGRAYLSTNAPLCTGLSRLTASLRAALFIAYLDAGHLWIDVKRRRWSTLSTSFDWWCGLDQVALHNELTRSLTHGAVYLAVGAAAMMI